jgi:hypothetical protein
MRQENSADVSDEGVTVRIGRRRFLLPVSALLAAIALVCPAAAVSATGPAAFTAPNPSVATGGHGFPAMAVADVNGDGKIDVVATNSDDNTISVLLGDGHGGLTAASGSPFATGGTFPTAVAVGDFNGDGIPDAVVADSSSGDVSLMLGVGSGRFQAGTPVAISVCNPAGLTDFLSLAVGDFNGDGHLDVAVADFYCGNVKVLLGDGNGGLAPAPGSPIATGGAYPSAIGVGNFNADSKPDLAVANSCPASGVCNQGSVSLLLGNGDGTFAPATGSPFPAGILEPAALQVGDVNGDGHPDVVVGHTPTAPGGLSVLLGDGQGGLTLAPGSPTRDASGPLALGDFLRNGRMDVAVPDQFGNTLQVLLSDAQGRLTPAPGSPYPIAGDPGYSSVEALTVATGDLNGDGKPDVVVGTESPFIDHTAYLSVMLNSFTAPAITSSYAAAFFVGQAGSMTITSTGIPAASLTETGALPTGVTFQDNGDGTATLAGTPSAGTAGTYSLAISGSNVVGSVTQAFRITVANCHGSLSGCNLKHANLSGTNLSGDNFSSANLSGANFTDANLEKTLFTNANLKNSNMSGADLTGADLTGANTSGITWSATTICPNGSPSFAHVGSTC